MTPQEVFDLTKAIAQDFGLADHVFDHCDGYTLRELKAVLVVTSIANLVLSVSRIRGGVPHRGFPRSFLALHTLDHDQAAKLIRIMIQMLIIELEE